MSHCPHILGHHISSVFDECIGTCCLGQVNAGTRTTSKGYHILEHLQTISFGITCSKHDIGNILPYLLVYIHISHHLAGCQYLLCCGHGFHLMCSARYVFPDYSFFLFYGRISYHHLEHESVHLSLGQRIGTLLLNRILGGHHEEWVGQYECVATYGHLLLLHGLEQCALHLSGCSVDFICEYEICKHGTFFHLEFLILLRIYHGTHHVGRQQVGCKLDSTKVCVYELR